MHNRLGRFVLAALGGEATVAAILFVAKASGFWLGGHSDNLYGLLKLTVPFALILAIVAALWPEPQTKRGLTQTFTCVAAGVTIALGYWYVVGRIGGLGFLGLAVEALASWIAAAAVGLLMALSRWRYGAVIGVVVICTLAIFLPAPIFNRIAHNQNLTVAIVVPVGLRNISVWPQNFGLDPESEVENITAKVLQTIRANDLTGDYRVAGLLRWGQGKQSLAILIVDAPVTRRVELPEPDAATVIYIEKIDGWTKTPLETPVLSRSIEVFGSRDDRNLLAMFGIPDANETSLMGAIHSGEEDHP